MNHTYRERRIRYSAEPILREHEPVEHINADPFARELVIGESGGRCTIKNATRTLNERDIRDIDKLSRRCHPSLGPVLHSICTVTLARFPELSIPAHEQDSRVAQWRS